MPTYRYFNPAHTVVIRDDKVISWNPETETPAVNQPNSTADEMKIWRDAGSPRPGELPSMPFEAPTMEQAAELQVRCRPVSTREIIECVDELRNIQTGVTSADDLAALKAQMLAFVKVVRKLQGDMRR